MKLKSPDIIIPDENPYYNDKLNRENFGNSLFNLFKNLEDNNVICLNAKWGEGKTSFLKMWIADLKTKDKGCIYFDAYANDHVEDPFIAFTSEILELLDKIPSKNETLKKYKGDFKKKAISIAKNVLVAGSKIGLKTFTAGLIDTTDLCIDEKLKKDISSKTGDLFSIYIENKISSFQKDKKDIEDFKKLLEDIGKEIKGTQDFPLLIIIDELDRCRPDFALLLLERIKHLFSANNVSFLISTNLEQLEKYIEKVYGSEIDSYNYLHKFFTITTTFPPNKDKFNNNYIKSFFENLCQYHQLPNVGDLRVTAIPLFTHLNFSLREIERTCAVLTIYFANNGVLNGMFTDLLPLVAIIKIKFPELFSDLLLSNLSYKKMNEAIKIDLIDDGPYNSFDKEWFKSVLKHLLLSTEEINALDEGDEAKISRVFRNESERRNFLPNIANTIERYNIINKS